MNKNVKSKTNNKVKNNNIKENSKIKNEIKEENKFINLCKDYFDFYKENFKKKHIIVYVISLVLFFIFLAMFISSIDVSNTLANININANTLKENILNVFKDTIPTVFLVIFAGITPYLYLSFIGFAYPYFLALDIANSFYMTSHTSNLICMTLGAIIEIFAISLAMVAGFYYCGFSIKRFRYSGRKGFSMYNVKKQLLEIKKDEKGIEKLNKEKELKDKKMESNNVKVPYFRLFETFVVSTLIAVIGALIALI